MGMTATEKILARASGLAAVRAGETVYPDPDLVIVDDGYIEYSKKMLDERRIHRLFDPQRVTFVTDHAVVYTSPQMVARGAAIRKAVIRRADEFIQLCSTMAYAFIRHPWAPINWGTGAYENHLTTVVEAYRLTGDPKYWQAAVRYTLP